ncbi:hypothetical protein KYG_04175 [Acidovorax sp. NO-1]|uniref:hypothetical protein n=1 Tax=Acidovorax sp. NO-1 TaxID=512030 RepID=UPI00023FCA8A|nr:hypothetical protein [Acidovorax sp. NO-1]EHL24145.1 hypothetical protein KYG_04175 [Acidovorax sp. NO-1]
MAKNTKNIYRPSNTKEMLPLPPPLRYFEAEPWRGENKPVYAKRDLDERLHCDDGVALRFVDSSEYWRHGRVHKDGDRPALYIGDSNAVELTLGSAIRGDDGDSLYLAPSSEVYCVDGVIHRERGAAIVNHGDAESFCMEYWHRGRRHCADGVAVQTKYVQLWYYHGLLHREDGPACIRSDFEEATCYWYGRALSFDDGLVDDFPIDEPPSKLILHALALAQWCPDTEDHRVTQLVARACELMPELNLVRSDLDESEWLVFRNAINDYLRDPVEYVSRASDSFSLPDGLVEEP